MVARPLRVGRQEGGNPLTRQRLEQLRLKLEDAGWNVTAEGDEFYRPREGELVWEIASQRGPFRTELDFQFFDPLGRIPRDVSTLGAVEEASAGCRLWFSKINTAEWSRDLDEFVRTLYGLM